MESTISKPGSSSSSGSGSSRREPEIRVNRRIRAREVRLIDSEGNQLGIMPPEQAMLKAMEAGLDLVEVSPAAKPPVCRILDYGKYKYELKKRQAEARKNAANVVVKEVKFRPKIEEHDYRVKVDRILSFLSDGCKVKVTMMFRGREITRQSIALDLMRRIQEEIQVVGTVEVPPKLEGRNMFMVLGTQRAQSAAAAK